MLWILIPITAFSFLVEIIRFTVPPAERLFTKYFGAMLRPHEIEAKPKMSGATYVFLSASLCVFIFPKVITVAGFAVLIISDMLSALIGRKYGKRKFMKKSVEGSTAFFVSAIIIVAIVSAIYTAPWQFFAVGIIAAFAATVAEALSNGVNIDDNLSIPLTFGAVAWGLLELVESANVDALLNIR